MQANCNSIGTDQFNSPCGSWWRRKRRGDLDFAEDNRRFRTSELSAFRQPTSQAREREPVPPCI